VRVAAAGFAAILAAIALALDASARADQASPFPSPSPVPSVAPGSGGYAAIDFTSYSAAGGTIPASLASSAPTPFLASSASGFSAEVLSHISDHYLADIGYVNASIHGDDHAIVTRLDASVLYDFGEGRTAAGIGYASVGRSTISASSNGFGIGAMLLPDFTRKLSPYASLFYYPSMPAPVSTKGGLSTLRLGIAYTLRGTSGIFARVGLASQNFNASSTSPTSLTGVELGIGGTF
jgi:hypothetical protein